MKRIKLSVLFIFLFFMLMIVMYLCSSKDKNFNEDSWARQIEKTNIKDLYANNFKTVEKTYVRENNTNNQKNGKYFNPWMKMKGKIFLDVLGWKLFSKTNYTDEEKKFSPEIIPDVKKRIQSFKGDFILWIGHNTFLLRINGIYWLTDPIFSKRALLPARVPPPALSLDDFKEIIKDVNILVSHNHYDHLDRSSMEDLPEHVKVYVPMGLKEYIMDMIKKNVFEMNWCEEREVDKQSKLICLPAQHWSLRINQGNINPFRHFSFNNPFCQHLFRR